MLKTANSPLDVFHPHFCFPSPSNGHSLLGVRWGQHQRETDPSVLNYMKALKPIEANRSWKISLLQEIQDEPSYTWTGPS